MIKKKLPLVNNLEPDNLKKRSLQGGTITIGNQALKFFLQVGSTMAMARLLSPGDFGLVAMVSSLLGFVNLVKDFGLSTATIQKASISQEELSGLFWINFILGIAILIVFLFCGPLVAVFYNEPRAENLTIAYGGIAMVSSLSSQHSALLLRQMKFGAVAICELAAMVIGICFGVFAAWYGFQFWALVIMQASNALAGTIFLWWQSGWVPGRFRKSGGLVQLLKFGGSLTLADLLGYANHNLDNILLGKYFGELAVGYYTRAQGILNKPLEQLLPPIMRVSMPMMSRLVGEPAKFKKASLQLTEIVCFCGCMLTMSVIPVADWIIAFLLGNQWAATVPVFKLLSIFGLLEPLAWLLGTLIVSFGMPNAMAQWRAGSMAIVVFSFLAGLPWGIIGVAAGYLISGIITRTWLIFFVGKKIGISGWEFLSTCAPFVVTACTVSIGNSFLRSVWEPQSRLVGIIGFILIGAIMYITLLSCTLKGRKFIMSCGGMGREIVNGFYRGETVTHRK